MALAIFSTLTGVTASSASLRARSASCIIIFMALKRSRVRRIMVTRSCTLPAASARQPGGLFSGKVRVFSASALTGRPTEAVPVLSISVATERADSSAVIRLAMPSRSTGLSAKALAPWSSSETASTTWVATVRSRKGSMLSWSLAWFWKRWPK